MIRRAVYPSVAMLLLAAAPVAARSPVQRDVEGYAIATCLVQQSDPALKAQGDGWGSIIVNRGRGRLEDWGPLIAVVKAEVRRRPMMAIKAETVAEGSHPMPVAFCSEIIDAPAVRTAITRTIARMAPAYARR